MSQILRRNFITATDSYKLTHAKMRKKTLRIMHSHLAARTGGEYDAVLFFGLQAFIKEWLTGRVIETWMIDEAEALASAHFGAPGHFDRAGWERIITVYNGVLPLRIRAVPEGSLVPTGNVLLTIENMDDQCGFLTNHVESLLLHVWYPITVATLSAAVKSFLIDACVRAGGTAADTTFMLHDFGYRGAATHEQAGIGGAAHLVNFKGTDTLEAIRVLNAYYDAPFSEIAYSVAASEHSVMTAGGPDGELQIVNDLIDAHPSQILSLVADSFDVYRFVDHCIAQEDRILKNGTKLVIRPDSVTPEHPTPEALVVWILHRLWTQMSTPGSVQPGRDGNNYRFLPAHYRVLWGDGIDINGIKRIVNAVMDAGFAPQNLVFGMGGGLLQKVNRDTNRFAIKDSAELHDAEKTWRKIYKNPLGSNKKSHAGRLALTGNLADPTTLRTVDLDATPGAVERNLLRIVFEMGWLHNEDTLATIRERASLVEQFPINQQTRTAA